MPIFINNGQPQQQVNANILSTTAPYLVICSKKKDLHDWKGISFKFQWNAFISSVFVLRKMIDSNHNERFKVRIEPLEAAFRVLILKDQGSLPIESSYMELSRRRR